MPSLAPRGPDGAFLAALTVLYVEDDAALREQLQRFLRRRVGCLVEAKDGAEALELFLERRPALVITDIQMPRLDGLALAEEIHRLDASVPIIVTTAFEQIDYLRRAIDVGVDRYVTKPVDPDKMEEALLACARRLRAEVLLARERQQDLERALAHEQEAIRLFSGGMAHDFNNMMQTILSSVEAARPMAAPGSEQEEILATALEVALQAMDLGRQLHQLSGPVSRKRSGSLEATLWASLKAALSGCSTSLNIYLPPNLPAVAHDAALLGKAFECLGRNACEAMLGAGTLSVVGGIQQIARDEIPGLPAGACVELNFNDTGPGIAPELLPKIFDPYFSTKQRGATRGLGLGLAVCRAILRNHGGLVTVSSRPGAGASFTVYLPAAPTGAAAGA